MAIARCHVWNHVRSSERADAHRTFIKQCAKTFLHRRQAANARADDRADVVCVRLVNFQIRLLERLRRGGNGVLNERIDAPRFFAIDIFGIIFDIEIVDLRRNLHGELGRVKASDAANG